MESSSAVYHISKLKNLAQLKLSQEKKFEHKVVEKVMLNAMRATNELSMKSYYEGRERGEIDRLTWRIKERRGTKGRRNLILLGEIKERDKRLLAE